MRGSAIDAIASDQPARRDAAASVPHTQIHSIVRRTLEQMQDVIAALLIVLLFALSLRTLWHLARLVIVEPVDVPRALSEIMFVLILVEVYRLLIFYLREHRFSVALAVEVALVSTLREVMLKGAHEFEWDRLLAISMLLVVLGGLLAAERWMGQFRGDVRETQAH